MTGRVNQSCGNLWEWLGSLRRRRWVGGSSRPELSSQLAPSSREACRIVERHGFVTCLEIVGPVRGTSMFSLAPGGDLAGRTRVSRVEVVTREHRDRVEQHLRSEIAVGVGDALGGVTV